jgi:hypothetical protein
LSLRQAGEYVKYYISIIKAVNNALRLTAFAALFALLPEPASGQNTFQEVTLDSGYYRLENTDNWSGGVLPDTTQGVINSTTAARLVSASDWDVVQNGGVVGVSNVGTSITLTDTTWQINGGTLGDQSLSLSGTSLVTVNSGGTIGAAGNRDITVSSGATIQMNGGTVSGGDQFVMNGGTVQGNGTINMNDIEALGGGSLTLTNGTITVVNNFGGRAQNDNGGGTYNLSNLTLNAGTFKVLSDNSTVQLNLEGTAAGSVTFGDWATSGFDATADQRIAIDFDSGTGMTLSMTSPSRALTLASGSWTAGQWAEALWTNDQLTYNGLDSGDYGDWATVTTTGFGDGNLFDLSGGTLSVTAIPEPGSFGLVALGLAVLFGFRRRSNHR